MNEKFRDRKLTDRNDKHDFNTWYDMGMPHDRMELAIQKIENDAKNLRPSNPSESLPSWNKFYKHHSTSFFRDRKWLSLEFPELFEREKVILEFGCGVGNSLIDLPGTIHACDFSSTAIELAKKRLPHVNFFQHDLTSEDTVDIKADAIILIFTLSAIHPDSHLGIFRKLQKSLKPGGRIYFKDYGCLDMIQLRYKSDQCVSENFYQRRDGTFTYFFSIEYLQNIMKKAGLISYQLFEDKKLHVNRKRNIDMYRVMIQGVLGMAGSG